MLQGLFLHCRKSSMLPRCIWAAGAHTGEERELYRGSGIVVSKELLDVLELQGCLHVRVVKDSSSKLPRVFFLCLLPAFCSVFHAWAPMLFPAWSLQASASDSVPIHPAHSCLQPCSLLFLCVHASAGHGTGKAGSPWRWEHGVCLSICLSVWMGDGWDHCTPQPGAGPQGDSL